MGGRYGKEGKREFSGDDSAEFEGAGEEGWMKRRARGKRKKSKKTGGGEICRAWTT